MHGHGQFQAVVGINTPRVSLRSGYLVFDYSHSYFVHCPKVILKVNFFRGRNDLGVRIQTISDKA